MIVYHDAGTVEVREIAGSGSTNDNGTSSAATNTTLTDTAKTWTADEWKGGTIEITAGPGSGQIRTISTNTATAITVSSAWDVNPFKSDNGTATGSTNTTLSDNTKNWQANEWQGAEVEITAGTGQGQKRTITGNTATQITVGAAWTTNPDATSQYTIRLGATYQLKIAYLQASAAWTSNPSEASRYVVVKKSRFWDEHAATPSAPSVCTVQDILTGVDLGFPGTKDNNAPVKNQAIWSRIWHDSDGVLATFRAGVGAANLPDSKIVPVPALYIMDGTTVGATSDADALVPGMVNLLVVKGSAATRAIIARPFACQAGGNDVFETTVNASLGGVMIA